MSSSAAGSFAWTYEDVAQNLELRQDKSESFSRRRWDVKTGFTEVLSDSL